MCTSCTILCIAFNSLYTNSRIIPLRSSFLFCVTQELDDFNIHILKNTTSWFLVICCISLAIYFILRSPWRFSFQVYLGTYNSLQYFVLECLYYFDSGVFVHPTVVYYTSIGVSKFAYIREAYYVLPMLRIFLKPIHFYNWFPILQFLSLWVSQRSFMSNVRESYLAVLAY